VEPTLEQLCRDSGRVYLGDFASEPDPARRIRLCIRQARRAYAEMPEAHRGLEPIEAIREIAASALTLIGSYVARNDVAGLGRLQALIEPFQSLSATFGVLLDLAGEAHDALLGRDVRERRSNMLARLEPPLEGLDSGLQHVLRCVVTYWLGMDEAAVCAPAALERAAALERQPLYAPLGAQVRSVFHLFSGNEVDAEASQRRHEFLVLQSQFTHITSASGIVYEAVGYYLCGSVLGLGRTLAAMKKLAARHPAWQPTLQHVEALHALLRGEPSTALELLGDAGADAAPVRVQVLLALGRVAEARAVAEQAVERHRGDPAQPMSLLRMRAAHARALCADGERDAAARVLDAEIERAEREGIGGMLLCVMHEARARIAVEMDDRAAFRRHIRKLGAIYGRGTAGLRARYEQLGVTARLALMSVPPQPPRAPADGADRSDVRTALHSATSAAERLSRALELLARRARASRGFLFGMQAGGLRLSATLGDRPPPDGLADMLAVYMSAEIESSETVPNTVTGTFSAEPDMVAWINDGQHLYYPVLLSCHCGPRRIVSGVAVLALPVQRVPQLPPELISEISRALVAAGDVIGADAAD